MKDTIKKYMLFAYIAITLLGAYSAAMVYMGTQLGTNTVHADTTVIRVQPGSQLSK